MSVMPREFQPAPEWPADPPPLAEVPPAPPAEVEAENLPPAPEFRADGPLLHPSLAALASGGAHATPEPWDVSKLEPAELQEMMADRTDPARAHMGFALANAQRAYKDLLDRSPPWRVLATTSPGTGGEPILLIVPPGFDRKKPANLQFHFHGNNSTVADPKGHGAGATARMEEVGRRDPQTIFVLPECRNAFEGNGARGPMRGNGADYAPDWTQIDDLGRAERDVLATLGLGPADVGRRVVSAHSGGGRAIENLVKRDLEGAKKDPPEPPRLACDELRLLDSLYGSEKAIAEWGAKGRGKEVVGRIVYVHATNDAGKDAAIAKAFGAQFGRMEVPLTRPQDLPRIKDAEGRIVYRYTNAHNRACGEFM
jgi:hypothetical protein